MIIRKSTPSLALDCIQKLTSLRSELSCRIACIFLLLYTLWFTLHVVIIQFNSVAYEDTFLPGWIDRNIFLWGWLLQFDENGAKILIKLNFRYITQYLIVVIGHICESLFLCCTLIKHDKALSAQILFFSDVDNNAFIVNAV